MKIRGSALRYSIVVLLLATAPTIASAYIDPGNGAYMVQALFTVVATLLFYLRHPVRTLKSMWHSIIRRRSAPSEESQPVDVEPATTLERSEVP